MVSRIAVISLDAIDPEVVATFWCQVLGWAIVERDLVGIAIAPADGGGPTIDILRVGDGKVAKNRLHLDLRADGIATTEELDRLVRLGARRVDIGQPPDAPWVVLADPEGNEFCLLGRSVQDLEKDVDPSG